MKNYLLIGNGLNRCLSASIAWGNLLKETAAEFGVEYNGAIPLPMEFEYLVNGFLKKNNDTKEDIYKRTKESIAKRIRNTRLPAYAIHYQLKKIPVNGIITTNYDSLLEQVYNSEYKYEGDKARKYLFNVTSIQNGIEFYHPHGMSENATSMCLGYEHYMGIVQHLRSAINTKENKRMESMRIKRVLCEEIPYENTWGELFYTANIAIVGLGLTECETDLWWLITHRASLFYSNYCGIQEKMTNQITFYDVINNIKEDDEGKERERLRLIEQQKSRHRLLENEHVEVRTFSLGSTYANYAEAYEAIIDNIKREGFSTCPA